VLFNSFEFILLFLPVTLVGFFSFGRLQPRVAAAWLTIASLFFYGWWNPLYVPLLVASIVFNYIVAWYIGDGAGNLNRRSRQTVLGLAIAANLLLLGYFKYANFFLASAGSLLGSNWRMADIILPLGISFFTFTQISFLVDTYQGKAREYDLVHYGLFVTYFPHLIAGPVLHHQQMMPQFARPATYRLVSENIAVGLTIFSLGLFKKVMIADTVAMFSTPVFDAAAGGATLGFVAAWGGALAYTFQIYFDFSGYSDMAIGLSRMFGIALPLNFNSPYKAVNIIDFWRRWHMTLSRFLRDYLYVPLGGNRRGTARRQVNLITTMLLGGLWHGAAWTFVIWGGLHGMYLVVNYAWQALRRWLGHDLGRSTWPGRHAGRLVTFAAVVAAWVFFRATSFEAAFRILKGMAGANGFSLEAPPYYVDTLKHTVLVPVAIDLGWELKPLALLSSFLVTLLILVWWAPNTQELMGRFNQALDPYERETSVTPAGWLERCPPRIVAAAVGIIFAISLLGLVTEVPSEFIYFQF
jgi:alginate O-acetyltransferase complex protein AlgI